MKKSFRTQAVPCEKCGDDTIVIDSRIGITKIRRRRRECLACEHRFTTFELTELHLRELSSFQQRFLQLQETLLAGTPAAIKRFDPSLLTAAGHGDRRGHRRLKSPV